MILRQSTPGGLFIWERRGEVFAMRTVSSSIGMRLRSLAAYAHTALLVALVLSQLACASKKAESNRAQEAGAQPGFFTVPQDQFAHLKIIQAARTSWGVAVHTTGTVDWDAGPHHAGHHPSERPHHADSGGRGNAGQKGRTAALRLQPRCGQRYRRLSQGAQPRGVQQTHRRPYERDCWITASVAQKDYESS